MFLQIEALKAIGVDEVILAINYQPEITENFPFASFISDTLIEST